MSAPSHARFAFSSTVRLAVLIVALPFVGCKCSDDPRLDLEIVSPENGALFTLADDLDPGTTTTIEIDVAVEATTLDEGEEVLLYRDAVTADVDAPIASGSVSGGAVLFSSVSFPSGEYRLQARARDGGVQSNVVRITVTTACARISFVTPTPPASGRLTLGPGDDTDGEMCGETFTTEIVVSSDAGSGTAARLFVNGTPRGTATIDGTLATFSGVQLDNRGSVPNSVAVEVVSDLGVTCREAFPAQIFVDCEGVSCAITLPDTASAYLSQADDVSDAEGFQTDFEVTSDGDAVGQPVELVVDGDESGARAATARMSGAGAIATFGAVPLSEGLHIVQAICTDAAGNRTRSGVAEWIVDITPCAVSLTSPTAGALIVDTDDIDPTTDGIQILVAGSLAGADCTGLRVGQCSGVGAMPFTGATAGSFSEEATLGTAATQELCAESEDEAGNVGRATVTLNVRTDAPQTEIVTPAPGTAFNVEGTGGRTADANPATAACEALFTVYCTDVGVPVQLRLEGTTTPLSGGTADCVADASAPSPYNGVATFPSVAIPTRNDGSSVSIVARQEADTLVGLSAAASYTPDCSAPALDITRPICGSLLRPSVDDEDTGTAGFQYLVRVFNANDPKPPVTLEIQDAGGSTVYTATSSTPTTGVSTEFPGASFGSGGELDLIACATDSAGNVGCAPACSVTVADLPTLTITNPASGAVLTQADDCDAGTAGLQIRVRATTNATSGSAATIQVGSGPVLSTTATGGVIDQCVNASDGRGLIITVTVTDPARGTAMAMRTVDIDTLAPTAPIGDLTATVLDRRAGSIRFTWTAVSDNGERLARYELRCAQAPITSEAQWTAAAPVTMTTVPGTAGTIETEIVSGFRPGAPRFCMIRGFDVAGRPTPLGNSPDATIEFLEQEVTGPSTIQLGYSAAAVGDVNGDGIDDALIGAPALFSGLTGTSKAFLYFGSTAGLGASPGVEIRGSHFSFGVAVAGIGDFNGDGRGDFAIAERGGAGGKGAVYVFFGRPATSPWPALIDLSSGCNADLCLTAAGGTGAVLFGWALASADFNGDGFFDLVVGASAHNALVGRVYVILGSAGFTPGTALGIPAGAIVPDAAQPAGFYVDPPAGVEGFGSALVTPGHFRGGAEHDLVIGAPGSPTTPANGAVLTLAGRAYPGAAVGLQPIAATGLTVLDTGTAGTFGSNLGVTDYDGDLDADLLVHNGTGAGQVLLYPLSSTGYSAATRVTISNDVASPGGDYFGRSVGIGWHPYYGALGRVDQGDAGEVLLGSTERGTQAGSVDLFYGADTFTNLSRTNAHVVLQPAPLSPAIPRIGAFVGDLNGDGFNDILVGDPGYAATTGRALIIY